DGKLRVRLRPLRFLKLWDVETRTAIWSSFDEIGQCVFISLLPERGTAIVATAGGEVRKLDLASGRLVGRIRVFGDSFRQNAHGLIAISNDGKLLFGEGRDDARRAKFKLIDLENERVIREFPLEK